MSTVDVLDEASVAVVREAVRACGAGLSRELVEAMATAASELGHNQLRHARRGRVTVRRVARGGAPGIEVCAVDEGEGIDDPTAAFASAAAPSGGLGVGLGAARRLVDELDVAVRRGEGTSLWIRRYEGRPAHPPELALLGIPHPHERTSGDDAAIVPLPDGFVIAVADGLGHGTSAREGAARAVDAVREAPDLALVPLFERAHRAAQGTRGAVMTVARFDLPSGTYEIAGLGNVAAELWSPTGAIRYAPTPGMLGDGRGRWRAPRVQEIPHAAGSALVVATDGIRNRVALGPRDLNRSAVAIAEHVLDTWGRGRDDATVVVAR